MKNARPKTRGEPSSQNLDIKLEPQVTDKILDKASTNNFSARRKTHNNTTDIVVNSGEQ